MKDIYQLNLYILLSACFNDKVTMSKPKAIAKISDIPQKNGAQCQFSCYVIIIYIFIQNFYIKLIFVRVEAFLVGYNYTLGPVKMVKKGYNAGLLSAYTHDAH